MISCIADWNTGHMHYWEDSSRPSSMDAFLRILRKLVFISSRKIVFDVDDVLWSFNARVCRRAGIDERKLTTYNTTECHLLTDGEKRTLLERYSDCDSFMDIVWNDGTEKIHTLRKNGDRLYANSNCFGHEVAQVKGMQLMEGLGFDPDSMSLNVVEHGKRNKKEIGSDVDIFVDDNLHNVACSQATLNIVPEKPWNLNPVERNVVTGMDNVISMPDTNCVMAFLVALSEKNTRFLGLE